MRQIKILIEKHEDGFVGYPVGLKGVVVGQGDTFEEVVADVKSAICAHVETFGKEMVDEGISMEEVYLIDAEVPI